MSVATIQRPRPSEQKHEAFYQAMCAEMKRQCVRDPTIRNIEIICVLGRLIGYCVAMCFPDERDLARQTAIVNMDQATADVAQVGPDRAGVRQV